MKIINLNSVKSSLSREEMRVINGGIYVPKDCIDECSNTGCGSGKRCVPFKCTGSNGSKNYEYLCFDN
ncbi:MAG TPA: hypothetical protein VNJ50_15015 [Gelidibacter sp.]|uniref:hypothetical protein n=1 Tax=Gelidibacter sp. TaxID=2018083 RepID=UPI002C03511B|nr:hypothetical protein [Gelidibacter sp.]HXK00162.1 hypothetical protein [Gelidibacter sp.]